MRIKDLLIESEDQEVNLMEVLSALLPLAMEELDLPGFPKLKLVSIVHDEEQPTFGRYVNDENTIYLGLKERHPLDIARTLAHELVHYKQDLEGKLSHHSGDTGSPEENEAHEVAGIIMRHLNKKHPEFFKKSAISL